MTVLSGITVNVHVDGTVKLVEIEPSTKRVSLCDFLFVQYSCHQLPSVHLYSSTNDAAAVGE